MQISQSRRGKSPTHTKINMMSQNHVAKPYNYAIAYAEDDEGFEDKT